VRPASPQVLHCDDSHAWSTVNSDIDFEPCNALLGAQLPSGGLNVDELVLGGGGDSSSIPGIHAYSDSDLDGGLYWNDHYDGPCGGPYEDYYEDADDWDEPYIDS